MSSASTFLRFTARLVVVPFAALLCAPSPGLAAPLLGPDLASFAVLGATPSVTNTGATTLTGQLGVSPAASITGTSTITINGQPADTTGAVFVHKADAIAGNAQSQLTTAITNLGLMGPGTVLVNPDLVGLTLVPGVYTIHHAAVSNLSGTVTLDGLGNANAGWVFQMDSDLITSSGSVVKVINTGPGAGIYWDVRSDATLNTTTSLEGNILALGSIFLRTGATIGCGRALANTAMVTMDTNTIGIGCSAETGGEGSLGFSGGLTLPTGASGETPTFLPFVPIGEGSGHGVPEPGSLLLFATGFTGLALAGVTRRRHRRT